MTGLFLNISDIIMEYSVFVQLVSKFVNIREGSVKDGLVAGLCCGLRSQR
jgi:hypothetical protein